MNAITCPRCAGDIEYEVEATDSGDGVWAQSGYVAGVLFTALVWDEGMKDFRTPESEDYTHGLTSCLCVWRADEIERLHDRATESMGPVEE